MKWSRRSEVEMVDVGVGVVIVVGVVIIVGVVVVGGGVVVVVVSEVRCNRGK